MSYLSFMKRNELWKRLVAKPPKMRLLVMLMCIFCTFNAMFANVLADKTVTIKSENISVKEALNMVKKANRHSYHVRRCNIEQCTFETYIKQRTSGTSTFRDL